MVREGRSFSGRERNCCFLNLNGTTFADVSAISGFDFPDDGRGVALCDWDFDGDVDLWITNRSGPQLRFLRNDLATPNHFLALRLEGKTCNRDAIGARVEVTLKNPQSGNPHPKLIKTLRAGEGFLAQSSKWLHFGLGAATEIEQVVVRWPGGKEELFGGLNVDRHYRVVQQSGKATVWMPPEREVVLEPSELLEPKPTERARVVSAAQLPLPPLDYETFDGQQRWLGQIASGQPMLVNLWASWCRPCLQELRELAQREAELREAGVMVVALSVDRLDIEKGTALTDAPGLLMNVGYSGKAGWATAATAEKLQLVQNHLFDLHQPMSIPTSWLIDSAGQLAVLYRGPVSVDQLLADVAQLPDLASSSAALPFAGRWHTRPQRLSPLGVVRLLVEHGYLEETIDYVAKNKKLLENHYNDPKLLLLVGNGLLAQGDTKGAISQYREALKIDAKSEKQPENRYSDPELLVFVGNGLLIQGDAKNAISHYREALKRDANSGEAENNLAWVLSTHSDASIRDGKEAIRLVTAVVKERIGITSSLLDTLAAAYAEDKQFEKAIATAKEAVEIAKSGGQHELAKKIEGRLQLYKAGQPYRDK